ncbi:MAG: CDP-glucose 4,6-dehydratase [Clostridia bacterium]|nr:CDP-glucose 4,6-dehydratase [Clostridia bacterium]
MDILTLKNFYHGKRVFVTGHTGFKGSWLIVLLRELGAEVCGYALEPVTSPNMFSLINGKNLIEHHVGDICDYNHLVKVMQDFKPEIVFHLAAQAIVITGYQQPRETYATNVMGTVNLLEAVRNTPSVKSVINVTTDKVYLNNDSGQPFVENDPLCGYDPYSNSKSCSELVTYSYIKSFFNPDKYAEHGVSVSTCRAGNVIGGGDWGEHRIIPNCIKSMIKNEPVVISNPNSTRPFQYVVEPLYMYVKLAMLQYENVAFAGSYNIGPEYENCISIKQLLDYYRKHEPRVKYEVLQKVDTIHEASKLALDITKAKNVLGYRIIYNIDNTIRAIVEWTSNYMLEKDMLHVTESQVREFLMQADKIYAGENK